MAEVARERRRRLWPVRNAPRPLAHPGVVHLDRLRHPKSDQPLDVVPGRSATSASAGIDAGPESWRQASATAYLTCPAPTARPSTTANHCAMPGECCSKLPEAETLSAPARSEPRFSTYGHVARHPEIRHPAARSTVQAVFILASAMGRPSGSATTTNLPQVASWAAQRIGTPC